MMLERVVGLVHITPQNTPRGMSAFSAKRKVKNVSVRSKHKNVIFYECGMVFDGKCPFEEWESIGDYLAKTKRHIMWHIGDWLNWGEARWGEKYAQALDATRYDYQTLRNASWVANRIPLAMRRESLSFEHHKCLAHLEGTEIARYLDIAESQHLSSKALRQLVRGGKCLVDETKDDVNDGFVTYWNGFSDQDDNRLPKEIAEHAFRAGYKYAKQKRK